MKHKMILEKENRTLVNKIESIKEEMKNQLDQFDEVSSSYFGLMSFYSIILMIIFFIMIIDEKII